MAQGLMRIRDGIATSSECAGLWRQITEQKRKKQSVIQ